MRIIAVAASVLTIAFSAPPSSGPKPPKLAVILVVDQMRADYVDRFQGDWTGGLKRLVAHGAWFRRAAYPYLTTVTCPGHATISTGTFPHIHGIPANQWWDRDAARSLTCTEDPKANNIGYDGDGTGGDSGRALRVPTFADRMRAERGARVVTLSAKSRSAIMLAGHGGDAVTWLSDTLDAWLTSSAFDGLVAPAVSAFISANPVDADFGRTWTPLLPLARFGEADDAKGSRPPVGWATTFPHVLNGAAGRPDASFRAQWDASPFADAYLGRLAESLVDRLQLGGRDGGTDVLGVSFSATDRVGHKFGPDSREIQDVLARLDRTIGSLFDRLDALVGRDEYVVALTGDHGVTSIPEQLTAGGKDGGRVRTGELVGRVEAQLDALGPGKHVAALDGRNMNLYFAPGVYQKLVASPALLDEIRRTIAAMPGVARVFRSDELRGGSAASEDRLLRAGALSYAEGRSGDLLIVLKPGWIATAEAASHGSANPDDQRVPILFMGRGINPGRYTEAVTPADIAPTLAAICGITMPQAEGHALRSALARGRESAPRNATSSENR